MFFSSTLHPFTSLVLGELSLNAGGGADNIRVSKSGDGSMLIDAGSGDDFIYIDYMEGYGAILGGSGQDYISVSKKGIGNLFVDAGADDDYIYIDSLEGNGTVLGGSGDDLLVLDARGNTTNSTTFNTMDGSWLNWNGGAGDDSVDMYFVSVGTTNMNIIGDGSEQVVVRFLNDSSTVLSRETFLANIHYPGVQDSSLERINLEPGALITATFVYLNEGENSVHFDGTISLMNIFSGDDDDAFYLGQMYHDVRCYCCSCFHVDFKLIPSMIILTLAFSIAESNCCLWCFDE